MIARSWASGRPRPRPAEVCPPLPPRRAPARIGRTDPCRGRRATLARAARCRRRRVARRRRTARAAARRAARAGPADRSRRRDRRADRRRGRRRGLRRRGDRSAAQRGAVARLALDHRGQRLARRSLDHRDHRRGGRERDQDDHDRARPAPPSPRPPVLAAAGWRRLAGGDLDAGRGAGHRVGQGARQRAGLGLAAGAAVAVGPDRAATPAVSPVCGRWLQLRRASAWAAASAADRRMARSAHQEQVPEARLPTAIPTIVPAVPIMLPRMAASTVPVAAAAMAGTCERKVSGLAGLADRDFAGVAVSRIMLSRRVMARRPYGFQTGSRYPIAGDRSLVITKAGECSQSGRSRASRTSAGRSPARSVSPPRPPVTRATFA